MSSDPAEQPSKNSVAEMYGLSPEDQKNLAATEDVLEQLTDAGAIITLVSTLDANTKSITIKHDRDIVSETDKYTQTEVELPKQEIGWMIPFENEGNPAFIVIDRDFNASVHFIKTDHSLSAFKEHYTDNYLGGKKINVHPSDTAHIHTDGVHITLEDPAKRLVPTNPAHIDQIGDWLQKGLAQAREKVVASMNATKQNRSNTLQAFANFSKEVSPPAPPPTESQ